MRKGLKKIAAIISTVAIAFSVGVPAMAATADAWGNGWYTPYQATVLFEKSKLMHQMAASPTRLYIILAKTESCPPHIQATKSNLKRPTSPQFMPPIIFKISAIILTIFIFITPKIKVISSMIPLMTFIH